MVPYSCGHHAGRGLLARAIPSISRNASRRNRRKREQEPKPLKQIPGFYKARSAEVAI